MHCEILWQPTGARYSSKALAFLSELAKFAPPRTRVTENVRGDADCLIVYGPTGRHGQAAISRYNGKPWVALDLGYWDRCRADYPMRVAICAFHPDGHLEDYGRKRWDSRGVELGDDYNAEGHVLVAGTGRKSAANGAGGARWDELAVSRAKRYFGNRIVYRPKPQNRHEDMRHPVQHDLCGAAYCITHHSNVGIDAIIQGIPVATDAGAARWLYDEGLGSEPASPERRLDFLRRLAWWNWKRSEVPAFWRFIQERIDERIQ